MIKKLRAITKEKYWDYFILVARLLLGWTFLRYGYGKLTDGQFGLTEAELLTPIKDLSLFRVSWYLFGHEPFNMFIGISQLVCGLLLILNRTAILGAFLFLPIVTVILIIDLTAMPPDLLAGFTFRLPFYILLDCLILWHYKDRILIIWKNTISGVSTKFKFPVWAYLILPILAICLEIIGALPRVFFTAIKNVLGS